MNKAVKVLITLGVFTLVVLYFVQACGNNKPVGNACENFNSLLMQKTEEYFSNNLPQEDGDVKTASIIELVNVGALTLSDLESIGTTCSGNVYVGKSGDNYYYSNDVTCGTCTTGNLYTSWSEWQDILPNIINENSQVQVGMFYNYGKGELKYTDWSEWALNIDEIEEPVLPTGVTIANTEKEEKTQYSYRDGSFKWYKLTGGTEYYSNGKYYETSPASGYSKDTSTKTLSRTTAINTSKTSLTSSLAGLDYDVVTTTAYKTLTPRYIYSYNKPTGCTAYKPLYKCYNITGSYTQDCYTSSSATALSACNAQSNVKNCAVKTCSTTSGGTWDYNFVYGIQAGNILGLGETSCITRCSGVSTNYSSCSKTALKTCLLSGNVSYSRCYSGIQVYWASSYASTYFLYKTCDYKLSSGVIVHYPSCDLYQCDMSKTNSGGTTTYTYGYTYDTVSYYNGGATYTSCSDKTGYTNAEATGTYSTTECTSAATTTYTTYYLKSDGTSTTIKSQADYLSDSEYSALGSLGSNYSKTSDSSSSGGTYVEGTCPGGVSSSTCSQVTAYKAKVYKYKWYKTTSSTKTWYNDGEYSATGPSGYQPDTSSAQWGEWSTFSDTKVTATSTRQVKTQIMKRIRKSYMGSGTLYLENFLPLGEFETKVGKTLAELSQDTSLVIQKKIMYRYRTLNIQ